MGYSSKTRDLKALRVQKLDQCCRNHKNCIRITKSIENASVSQEPDEILQIRFLHN
jgi:hypothetical protein